MYLTDLQKNILNSKGFDFESENFEKEIDKFLNPNFDDHIFDGAKIKDMIKAVERIKKAIDTEEKIVIYSDYDCDGIPGAVVLHDFFKKLEESKNKISTSPNPSQGVEQNQNTNTNFKINFINYIPHRHNEGYGLNMNAIKKLIESGYTLMITVDCGITNIEEIKFAEENGLNVILTDHHLPILTSPVPSQGGENSTQILPPAFAVINTKRDDCEYEEKFLCGCATAWKIVNVFLNKYREEFNVIEGWEKWLLDMVAISTIADMVPLQNENRVLAKFGFQVLKKSSRPGLQKIFKNAKIDQKKINEEDIGFGIAPRLNAASRMAEPMHAFYALLQNEEAVNFANQLEKYNDKRKIETKDAHGNVDYEKLKDKKIILIGSADWGPGIIGLIASKVVDATGKTAFVWGAGEDKNIMKGSVRAGRDNLNVVQIMTEANLLNKVLENFGGHEAAGGFAIHKDNLKKFEEFLNSTYPQHLPKEGEQTQNTKIQNKPKYITTNYIYKYIKDGLREQKKKQTNSEEILWQEIKTKKLGFKFRRQHIIDIFVPDFVCLEKMLIIEVDGEVHNLQKDHDKERQEYLESLGYKVIRFKNEEIENNLKNVLIKIKNILDYECNPSLGGVGGGQEEITHNNFFEIKICDINKNLFEEIKIFSPFGMGNEKIIFKIKKDNNIFISGKRFGKNKNAFGMSEHLEINFKDLETNKVLRAIQFFADESFEKSILEKGEWLVNLEWDNYRNDIVLKFVK